MRSCRLAWVEQAGSPEGEIERFSRLLSEQLTPSGIAQEMASNVLIGAEIIVHLSDFTLKTTI